jgi:K+-sensing histidine kinase KdpD
MGYAHVVSHDLKAPLATIKLAATTLGLLSKKPASEENDACGTCFEFVLKDFRSE